MAIARIAAFTTFSFETVMIMMDVLVSGLCVGEQALGAVVVGKGRGRG
jgi:hypothetical protein